MNNLGSVLKDVARYEESFMASKGGGSTSRQPSGTLNVLFTLVGYELGHKQGLQEAQRFAAALASTPSSAGATTSQIQIRKDA